MADVSNKFDVIVSPRFEVFYALQVLVDSSSRIHPKWRERSLDKLPPTFFKKTEKLGNSSVVWSVVADTLRKVKGDLGVDDIADAISKVKLSDFQLELLEGTIHSEDLADRLISKKIGLPEAFGKVPKLKQEWLAFIGLYPYLPDAPISIALQLLINDPKQFQEIVTTTLDIFVKSVFHDTWKRLEPQLERSAQEKSRLLHSCSFGEFSKSALLRIEVDDEAEIIRAARGGYELPMKRLRSGYLMPSAFNDKRYWTAYEYKDGIDAYFPYFDPTIAIDLRPAQIGGTPKDPEIDPFLIFKALGDPTRYAIMSLIATNPCSAVEISRNLKLSKPTISHHVHLLRDSGLIEEQFQSGSVILSPKKELFHKLGDIAYRALFSEENKLRETKSNKGKKS